MSRTIAFNKGINFTVPAPTISSVYPGAMGNYERTLALGLNEEETVIFSTVCFDCKPTKDQILLPYYAYYYKNMGNLTFNYDFADGSVCNFNMIYYNDNLCVNDFCMYSFNHWVLPEQTKIDVVEDGVLGLAYSNKTEFFNGLNRSFQEFFSLTLG